MPSSGANARVEEVLEHPKLDVPLAPGKSADGPDDSVCNGGLGSFQISSSTSTEHGEGAAYSDEQ